MTTNSDTKTITATSFELPLVKNYLEYVVPVTDRKNWKVNILDTSKIEYRSEKK